jgi:hypothetical protein
MRSSYYHSPCVVSAPAGDWVVLCKENNADDNAIVQTLRRSYWMVFIKLPTKNIDYTNKLHCAKGADELESGMAVETTVTSITGMTEWSNASTYRLPTHAMY